MNEYQELRSEYDPNVRCAECPDDDASEILGIEVGFAIATLMTQDQQRRLVELVGDIVRAPWNQPKGGVYWPSGCGSKPHWSKADARMLGIPADHDAPESGEPEFDDSIYAIETCAREFVSFEERDRKAKRRAKEAKRRELDDDQLRALLDTASVIISQLCSKDYWGRAEQLREKAKNWLAENDLTPSPLRTSPTPTRSAE